MNTAFSALTSAAAGIRTNLRGLNLSAQRVASASVTREEPIGLVDPLVESLIQQRAIEASANVMKRIDDAIGSIFDAFA